MIQFFAFVGVVVCVVFLSLFVMFLVEEALERRRNKKAKEAMRAGLDECVRFSRAWVAATPEQRAEHIGWCRRCQGGEP